ncbi:DMT family transporter [Variovorax sp. PCZ-1]|uniref:DMT family transporter n=1 Tax=Variovorax sp. PCZ-1 TaxID=2835533 RepID=UPI001BCD879E|nr:DMT family transporter [Variovorax sp. PCZ-1]MBS7808678.1 DMT family transporter [Variovorax sp. PCZ-1]
MGPKTSERLAFVLLLLTPALWSVNYLVARLAPGEIAPHMLALGRWALAACVLGVFAFAELKAKRHLILKNAWHYLVLGALGMWVCGAWVYIGARSTSATNIALIYSLSPAFIVLCASVWLHEKLRGIQWLGIALAMAGLVHVVIKGQWGNLLAVRFVAGDLWILACAFSWAGYALLMKRWPTDFSPMARLVLTAIGGCIVLLPFTVIEAMSDLPLTQTLWGWKSFALIVASGLLPGALAYWAYGAAQKSLGAARTAMALYMGPLYGALLGWAVLGEAVSAYHAIGAALILPGLYLASLSPKSA